jgi:hypothetical protein
MLPVSGGFVKKLSNALIVIAAMLIFPYPSQAQENSGSRLQSQQAAALQQNVPAEARQVEADVESAVKRFGVGVFGGVALDPELIDFGAHATFGPIFLPAVQFRPGVEFGLGEVTTMFAVNLDVVYTLPGATRQTRWTPYAGAGPNFTLSHQGFELDTTDTSGGTTTGTTTTTTTGTTTATTTSTNNRFNFGDTDFSAGFNFFAGVRRGSGMFLELRATAYGVSNVRLLVGYNF